MNDKLRNMNEDWVEVELGEVLEIERGGSPRPIKEYITDDEDGINWVKIGDTKGISKYITKTAQKIKPSGLKKSRMVYPNDFILSNSMSFGKPYIMNTEGAIHDGWLVLRDSYNILNKEFLYYALSSPIVYNQFSKLATGSTVKNLNIRLVQRVKIIFRPIPEQLAIAKKIESLFSDLDNGIANLKKAQEQLKIYRQAVLKKAFEGELTKEWREQRSLSGAEVPTAEELLKQIKEERQKHYNQQIEDWKKAVKEWEKKGKEGKKPTKPKAIKELPPLTKDELKELPKLPDGWKWCKIGENFISLDQGWSPRCENYPSGKDEWGVIKTTAIQPNSFEQINNKKLPINLKPKEQHELKNGDILITRAGPRVRVGVSCLVKNVRSKLINCDKAYRIRSVLTIPEFIVYLLNSPVFSREMEKTKSGISDSGLNLKQDIFLKMPIPLPTLEEQHQIIQEIETRLSVCDKVEQSISESLEKAKALRQSILKKAFEGRLLSESEIEACKQEKDYEPASVLLARIERSRNEKIKARKVKTQNYASQRKTKNKAKK